MIRPESGVKGIRFGSRDNSQAEIVTRATAMENWNENADSQVRRWGFIKPSHVHKRIPVNGYPLHSSCYYI